MRNNLLLDSRNGHNFIGKVACELIFDEHKILAGRDKRRKTSPMAQRWGMCRMFEDEANKSKL